MEVKKRVGEGQTVRDISRELGISKSAVGRIRQEVCHSTNKAVPTKDMGRQGQQGQYGVQPLPGHCDGLESITEGGDDVPF